MKPTLIAAGVVFALALSETVWAADEARFYPPGGWIITKQPDGPNASATATIQPPGVPAGKTCLIMIMPNVHGEVNVVFATSWRTLTEPLKVVSGGEPRARRSIAEFETRSTTAVVNAPDTGRAYMHFFAVQAGPIVRRALFLSDDKATFDKHLPAAAAMFDSLGIDPATAKPLAAAAPTTGPGFEGVFYRGGVALDAAGERGELAQRVDFLCFAPDGRAYNGHPAGGPVACFENEDPRSPNYGTYGIDGDDIVIKWNHDRLLNQQHTQKLKRRPDGKLEQDGVTFHKLEPRDGLKLDGTYAIRWADGSTSRIRFTNDGRFSEQGLKDCVNFDQLAYPDWPKLPARGDGTYSIRRNTLEVKYDNDGPIRRMFFTTPGEGQNPKRISIANNPMEREP